MDGKVKARFWSPLTRAPQAGFPVSVPETGIDKWSMHCKMQLNHVQGYKEKETVMPIQWQPYDKELHTSHF